MAFFRWEAAKKNYSYFYKAVTKIAEDRIKELIQHAKEAEVREDAFPNASSYFRGCAHIFYLAWRDITDGWEIESDIEKLESLIGWPTWTGVC